MFRWIKIIKFVKKYRKLGILSFKVVTDSDTFIMYVIDEEKGIEDQIRIKYYG